MSNLNPKLATALFYSIDTQLCVLRDIGEQLEVPCRVRDFFEDDHHELMADFGAEEVQLDVGFAIGFIAGVALALNISLDELFSRCAAASKREDVKRARKRTAARKSKRMHGAAISGARAARKR